MAQHLTDATVKRLPLPDKNSKLHYDADVAGLAVRVTTAGARSFVLRYRVRGSGRERTYTIGSTGNWRVTAARAKAKRLRSLIDEGGDPLGDIEDAREAPTVADLIDRFLAEHVEPRLRPGTVRHYRMLIERYIRPHFGSHTKVADVAFADLDQLHRKISKSGASYAANRAIAICSKMFALAVRWDMRDDNPAKGVERNYEQKRKRYLAGDELARLTAALAAFPNRQIADIFRVLLLTGARRGEVGSMRWADVDLTAGNWSKPGSTTKQKADHDVPLSAPARQLLSEIRTQQTAKHRPLGEFVFPSEGKSGHVVELARAWRRLCKSAKIADLHIHDLRHSFASQLASGGASLPLIGALLGHSNPATTARYAHLFDDPQRAAVERVGAAVAAAEKDAEATVAAFPKGGRHGR
jgi:integrase